MRPRSNKARPHGSAKGEPHLTDALGNFVWRLAEPRIIRRPNPSPNNRSGGFYYNILLDYAPFRDEDDVHPADGDYFKACVRMGIIKSEAELDELIVKYTRYNMWNSAKLEELRGQVLEGVGDAAMPLGATHLDAIDASGDTPAVLLAGVEAMQQMQHLEGGQLQEDAPRADLVQRMHAAMAAGEMPEQPPAVLRQDKLQREAAEAHRRTHPTLTTPVGVPMHKLSAQQAAVISSVIGTLQSASTQRSKGAGTDSAKPIIITLQGGPGTGKSALTRMLVTEAIANGFPGLVTATAATAAQRLGFSFADTIDAACQIPVNKPLPPMRNMDATTMALQAARFVVCDELSMLTSSKLLIVLHRLSQATKKGQPRKVLLLVGDLSQLPPVCRHNRRKREEAPTLCESCHLMCCQEFTSPANTHHMLDSVYRQAADPEFADFLGVVRRRQPTEAEIEEVLGDCMRPPEALPSLLSPGATILCTHRSGPCAVAAGVMPHIAPGRRAQLAASVCYTPTCRRPCRRADVRAHNTTALEWHRAQGLLGSPIYAVHMQHDAGSAANAKAAKGAAAFVKQEGFHDLTHVAVGARVMYVSTVNKASGATNSKQGTIVGIKFADAWPEGMQPQPGQQWVESLKVVLDGGSGKEITVRRCIWRATTCHSQQFSKRTFPLILAYAMTAHRWAPASPVATLPSLAPCALPACKAPAANLGLNCHPPTCTCRAQGATLEGITILHVRSAFAPGITYVMLSRATRRSNIYILGGLLPVHFQPVALCPTQAAASDDEDEDDGAAGDDREGASA